MDHRHSDDDHFAFFRKGEWMTEERVGYGFYRADHNNVACRTTRPATTAPTRSPPTPPDGLVVRVLVPRRPEGARAQRDRGYAYALGDATGVHNATSSGRRRPHLSRSTSAKPDHAIDLRSRHDQRGGNKRVHVQLRAIAGGGGASARAAPRAGRASCTLAAAEERGALERSAPAGSPANGAPMT